MLDHFPSEISAFMKRSKTPMQLDTKYPKIWPVIAPMTPNPSKISVGEIVAFVKEYKFWVRA